ncbi:AraC family transcriptional regulator [Massilia sp. DJPM01]|uniref:AraC family transcriptional regulator n=1 Tax=Massilia sp. DJPM01 TaxID=3024404 RepID=UPI00259ECDC7|nr:AraC family transcriptional regulator [Massilia sp. DJPM01]MDM5179232.1 AraC family transcriptional regulator [Massilia sp. DJPM01]
MNDHIDLLLQRFSIKSRVFFAGNLCNITNFDAAHGVAHLHVLRAGRLDVIPSVGPSLQLERPSLLLFPLPTSHRLIPAQPGGADMTCSSVEFGLGLGNPLVQALPGLMLVPLADAPGLQAILDVFFDEAFNTKQGQSAALRRLAELVLILTIRHALERGLLKSGMMSGLADPRLSKTLQAIHDRPAEAWTLHSMADTAGMSRARFAHHFQRVVGAPPGDYLNQWRISVAQSLLLRGKSLGLIADEVGYGSATALTRAFTGRVGLSPTSWLASRE